jgi:hypothetical protein
MGKPVKILIAALTMSISLLGCSASPSDTTIQTLITEALRKEVHPLVLGNLLGGSNASIEELEILNKSQQKDVPNPLFKTLGAKPQVYWLVEVRVRGVATVGGSDAISAMLSGGSVTRKRFHAEMKYKFFQDDDGGWYVRALM